MKTQKEVFREEASELLVELESSLLGLEETPEDAEYIGSVFRALHTLKGSGAMSGFNDIAIISHELETIFDNIREGKMAVTVELISLCLFASDQIKSMLDAPFGGQEVDSIRTKGILAALKEFIEAKKSESAEKTILDADSNDVTYRIRFRPSHGIFANGTNPIILLNELRMLGIMNAIAQIDKIPLIDNIDPEACYTYWDIVLTSKKDVTLIRDVFIFIEDEADIRIEAIDESSLEDEAALDSRHKRLGEILIEREDIAHNDLMDVLAKQKRIGELLVEEKILGKGVVESALAEQQHVKEIRKQRKDAVIASSVRVPSEKLDALVNLTGELVTVQSRLTREALILDNPELIAIAEEVERLTEDLRYNTMNIRMLPIGMMFGAFQRLVRDLSKTLGKEAALVTEGSDTEVDKSIIEGLNDPLIHIIRNSIDHGIENPKNRKNAGKAEKGTIRISASHVGAEVMVRISDDGAGIDPEVIRRRAIEKKLIALDDKLSDKEILSQIFVPGFSTSETITDISGRGVGLDVVKRGVEKLRGTIEIESQKGIGTIFTINVPLTLAIIDGLLVKAGDTHFVVPLLSVDECIKFDADEIAGVRRLNLINLKGKAVPYLNLRDIFAFKGNLPADEQIVVARQGDCKIGFGVDHILGQHRTVIKPLGKIYRDIKGVAGASVLGDGTVALILDIARLASLTHCKATF